MTKKNFDLQALLNEVSEITKSGLPFMEGKEKIEASDVLGKVLTVKEYDYMQSSDGDYVVLVLKEYPDNFMYGASVVTEAFKKFDSKFTEEQKQAIMEHGLTIKLGERKSTNKRTYTTITFFPAE